MGHWYHALGGRRHHWLHAPLVQRMAVSLHHTTVVAAVHMYPFSFGWVEPCSLYQQICLLAALSWQHNHSVDAEAMRTSIGVATGVAQRIGAQRFARWGLAGGSIRLFRLVIDARRCWQSLMIPRYYYCSPRS